MSEERSPVLTVEEARKLARVGRRQFYELIQRNEVPHLRLGKSIRIPRLAFLRMLNGEGQGDAE